jgi:hypothetical protein
MKRKDVYMLAAGRLRAEAEELSQGAARLRWSLRRTSEEFNKGVARDLVAKWAVEHEHYRRMGAVHLQQNERDIAAERRRDALLAAGVNRYLTEPRIRELQQAAESLGAEAENDIEVTLPTSLDHVDANGLLMVEILSELRRPRLLGISPGALLQEYFRAIDEAGPAGYATIKLIEALEPSIHAKNEEERSATVALKEEIHAVRKARRPAALDDVEMALDLASKVVATCGIAGVGPIIPMGDPTAKAAWEAESAVWEAEQQAAAAAAAAGAGTGAAA